VALHESDMSKIITLQTNGKTNQLLTSIPTGVSIVDGVAYDSLNNNIYAVDAGSGTLSVIDGSSNTVTDSCWFKSTRSYI
jgi:DNA-binding beta-propeller fold protein YncE